MNGPADQAQRERFITELTRNFSVIASAGSGKTRAVTERIAAIAKHPRALEWLPTLAVVTFTNRAADEMQQRARQQMLEAGVPLAVHAAFNRAFFGTIHSFCVKLLREHGHLLGLRGEFDASAETDALWMEFVQQQTTIGSKLTDAQRRCVARLVPARDLMELARTGGTSRVPCEDAGEFPEFDFAPIHALTPDSRSRAAIDRFKRELRAWERHWRERDGFLPLPSCSSKAQAFVAVRCRCFSPIREWMRRCSFAAAAEIELAWRDFRLSHGVLTFDDQVALARELLRHPEAARRIRERNYRVILDEAQDTDPVQFSVLLEAARLPDASGDWPETRADPPRRGHFCMVGDFQQSIFGDRADLACYQRIHEALIETGEELTFSVTFRLDRQQVDFLNATFGTILHGQEPQVKFVPMSARPGAMPGQIVRLELGELPDFTRWRQRQKTAWEAQRFSHWLRAETLETLRAESWSDVAVICPRRSWFAPLRNALRAHGFEVQIQSERDVKGDSRAYAWFAALLAVIAEPRDGYEIVGVLREVFGLSDHELALFADGSGERFQIAETNTFTGYVGETLRLLFELRERIAPMPLFAAAQEVVRGTRLHERLLSLPDSGNAGDELDDLLTLAAGEEAAKKTLHDLADLLRAEFTKTRDVRPAGRDAIQLITGQKAKGSEWQVVIVPFFGLGPTVADKNYPRLIRCGSERRVVLESADLDAELKRKIGVERQHEFERLLYVALTRAKHTLVIVDDGALFQGRDGLQKLAQARLLRIGAGGENAEAFTALPTNAQPCAATAAAQRERPQRQTVEARDVDAFAPLSPDAIALAQQRAAIFVKRNPSALAEALYEESAGLRPAVALGSGGTDYGVWWHGLVESLAWDAPPTWEKHFADVLPASPDAARSRREWKLLRAALADDEPMAGWLTGRGSRVHCEMPLLWRMSDSECLEGVIDAAVEDTARGEWLILDWKTNRIDRSGTAELQAHYEPQIAAYQQAVSEIVCAPVRAALFSTALGAWLPYESSALAAAWKRISRDPAAVAAAAALE